MVWKEKLEKIIEGIKKAREIEKYVNAVKEVLKQLDSEGIIKPYVEEDIKYYPEDKEAVAKVGILPHWKDLLIDFTKFVLGKKYRCVGVAIEVSTKNKRFVKPEDIEKRVLLTGNDYRGRMLAHSGYYMDYIFLGSAKVSGIDVYVYFVIYSEDA